MKRVRKATEPVTLSKFRSAVPNGTWDCMRNDTHWDGQQAILDARAQALVDQGGLCAYCEIDIADNNPLKCRIEHFHPKSDLSRPPNWALDWCNMIAVCNGGSHRHVTDPGFLLEPMTKNLSCDAHKDQRIQVGDLPAACEGWILNPLEVLAFPCLFKIKKIDGSLEPDLAACGAADPWPSNRHLSTADLVQHTIDMLNLNCDRLNKARLALVWDIENNKKKQQARGISGVQGMSNLVNRYFRRTWPSFFTVIRSCLGQAAEAHLQAKNFEG